MLFIKVRAINNNYLSNEKKNIWNYSKQYILFYNTLFSHYAGCPVSTALRDVSIQNLRTVWIENPEVETEFTKLILRKVWARNKLFLTQLTQGTGTVWTGSPDLETEFTKS